MFICLLFMLFIIVIQLLLIQNQSCTAYQCLYCASFANYLSPYAVYILHTNEAYFTVLASYVYSYCIVFYAYIVNYLCVNLTNSSTVLNLLLIL